MTEERLKEIEEDVNECPYMSFADYVTPLIAEVRRLQEENKKLYDLLKEAWDDHALSDCHGCSLYGGIKAAIG